MAILNRDASAVQPACGRHAIVFIGEIYIVGDLRLELETTGEPLRTTWGIEMILRLFARQVEAMPSMLNGRFVFGSWNKPARRTFSVRDRNGLKPLGLMQRIAAVQGVVA